MAWKFDEGEGMYDVAQICLNGHVTNDSTQQFPQASKKFCPKCGAATTTVCPTCGYPIRGDYISDAVVVMGHHYKVPGYCENCGRSYPWTDKTRAAAEQLAKQLPGLTEAEKGEITESLDDLVMDTPKSKPAALKVKTLLAKAGGEAAGMLRDLVVAVSSEAVKKVLLGP
jgi:hypothetical protein